LSNFCPLVVLICAEGALTKICGALRNLRERFLVFFYFKSQKKRWLDGCEPDGLTVVNPFV